MRHGLVALAFLLLIVRPAWSADTERTSKPAVESDCYDGAAKLATKAIAGLKKNGLEGFLDVVCSGESGALSKEERPKATTVFTPIYSTAISQWGKSNGEVELVRTDLIGKSYVRFTYLEKLERKPILWSLVFYRGQGSEWNWSAFQLYDKFDAEFRTLKLTAEKSAFEPAQKLAKEAEKALSTDGVSKLFDCIFAEGKTKLPAAARAGGEANYTQLRDKISGQNGKAPGELEFLHAEAIGESLVQFVYLEKWERNAAIWKFCFYRDGSEWKWLDVNLSGDVFTGSQTRP